MTTPLTEHDAFRVSRIYGEGWRLAKQLLAAGAVRLDPKHKGALNPYRHAVERARWSKGFEEALLSSTGPSGLRSPSSWRARAHKR